MPGRIKSATPHASVAPYVRNNVPDQYATPSIAPRPVTGTWDTFVASDKSPTHRNKSAFDQDHWCLSPLEATFRHGFWAARRQRVYEALEQAGVPQSRLANFAACGCAAMVKVEQTTGQIAVDSCHCHDRLCQACGQQRAKQLQLALAERVPKARCLHVVLTLRSSDADLSVQLTRLYRCASKLRSRKWWRGRVTGGMASLELTRNANTGQWHPHLHCLLHADWLDQAKLSTEWLAVTGDSSVVHVSLVDNAPAAIKEVTKYVTKPVHRSIDFSVESLVQLIHALRGRHLVATFGSWRSDPLLTSDDTRDAGNWLVWGSLHALHAAAATGDAWAQQALLYLTSLAPGRIKREPPTRPPPS